METKKLMEKTKADLLEMAKILSITGRHELNKMQLIDKIEAAKKTEEVKKRNFNEVVKKDAANFWEKKSKDDYINNIKEGNIIAFKVSESKALSGKIVSVNKKQELFIVETKNGIVFFVKKENIIWVKTTDRWPKGVYLALKGVKNVIDDRKTNS